MKKLLCTVMAIMFIATFAQAQTATELLGKWKLIKWTTKGGKDKAVKEDTYQVFKEKNIFISISEGKEHKGKWKLSEDQKTLKIRSGIIMVDFSIDYFDAKRRVITSDQVGSLEYVKVDS